MKILYAIQATGNGHISRAMEILPYLKQYGKVDIFLSGANSSLPLDVPVKYRSRGLSLFYTPGGSLDYMKMAMAFSPVRIQKEVNDLPVEKYDLVINDFESITSMACAIKKVPSVNFGHQASFHSDKCPRPAKTSFIGEWILRNYARASRYIGLHFECYDDFIFSPIIKQDIIDAVPDNHGHITVYLSSYADRQVKKVLEPLKGFHFEVFSKEAKRMTVDGNIVFIPVNKRDFNNSLITSHGVITGAGFEAPAEALYLGKKLMVVPIRGQYEQLCNAAALEKIGIPVISRLDETFGSRFMKWICDEHTPSISFDYSTDAIVQILMYRCANVRHELDMLYPDLVFN